MCFYHDYDFRAEINDTTRGPAPTDKTCDECHRRIPQGSHCLMVYQQEHEPHGDSAEELGEDEEFDPGHTCEYTACDNCDKVRQAIVAVEEANGCSGDETQPALFQLFEAISDSDEDYAGKAKEMFPDLSEDYLDKLPKPWRLEP